MALRGSPARRIVGAPLAGVLGHIDQRARIAGRMWTSSGPREADPVPAPVAVPPAAAPAGPVGAVLETGEDGRATWSLPAACGPSPAVTATAVDPAPEDGERTVWAALEDIASGRVTVRAWRSRGRRGTGVAEPAGAGVRVHVMAVAVESGHE
ncbi:hypothetical protein [Streptomyces collinus]